LESFGLFSDARRPSPGLGAALGEVSRSSSETSLSRLVLWLFANPLLRFDDLIELRLMF
jgi:hypothetical protein